MNAGLPGPDRWRPWAPQDLARRLAGIARPWSVAGGWALDLWHGVETRTHSDLEFCVLRGDVATFRQALRPLAFQAAGGGQVRPLQPEAEPADDVWQLWGLDRAANAWRVDMMVEPGSAATWRFKRDTALAMPRAQAVAVSGEAIPYLDPAIVLLFKAKATRPKDAADFGAALPRLGAARRDWLARALDRVHPGHPWRARL